jgi:hypothetical protein
VLLGLANIKARSKAALGHWGCNHNILSQRKREREREREREAEKRTPFSLSAAKEAQSHKGTAA